MAGDVSGGAAHAGASMTDSSFAAERKPAESQVLTEGGILFHLCAKKKRKEKSVSLWSYFYYGTLSAPFLIYQHKLCIQICEDKWAELHHYSNTLH